MTSSEKRSIDLQSITPSSLAARFPFSKLLASRATHKSSQDMFESSTARGRQLTKVK
jgi:hypothetical protein